MLSLHPLSNAAALEPIAPCDQVSLSPLAVNGGSWSGEPPRRSSHTFNCRMLVNPLPDSEEEGHDSQEAHQKYEAMQCFAVSQPKSIKEEGEGRTTLGERGHVSAPPSCARLWLSDHTLAGAHREDQEATS